MPPETILEWLIRVGGEYGGWLAIAYILITIWAPKLAPAYAKAKAEAEAREQLSLKQTQAREDRLFDLVADTNTLNAKLAAAIDGLTDAFTENTRRLEKIEDTIKGCERK